MTSVSESPGADGSDLPDVSSPGAVPRAIVALGGGEILSRLVAFATTTMLARKVGPEGFGVLGFASALCGYFALGIGGSLGELGARDVARNHAHTGRIYAAVVSVRVPLALISATLLGVLAWALPRSSTERLVIALSGLSLISAAIDPAWAVKALGRTTLAAATVIATQLLILIGVVALVAGPTDVAWVPAVQVLAEGTSALILAFLAMRAMPAFAWRWREGLSLLRESLPLLFGRGMRVVIVSFDMVMLGVVAQGYELGLYAAVYRLHFFVLALVVAVQLAYLPPMARAASRSADDLRRLSQEALSGAAFVGAPLIAGGFVLAAPLLAFLFGERYAAGALALQWLLVSLACVFVHGLLHNIYVVTGRTHLEARWFAWGAAINVLANLWLIPQFGIAGAAAATAIAEGVVMLGGIVVTRVATVGSVLSAWATPSAAAAVMAFVVWLSGDTTSVVLRCLVGAAIYAGAVAAFVGPRALAARFRLHVP